MKRTNKERCVIRILSPNPDDREPSEVTFGVFEQKRLKAVGAGAGAHGYVTGRWLPSGPTAALVMPAIPETSGAWQGETIKSSVQDQNLRNLTRQYTHTRTGRVLTMSLTPDTH